MNREDIANYAVTERLRDHRSLTIRAIRPDDKGLVIDALRKVSAESLYLRFFSAKGGFTDGELTQATDVDFANVVALVAVLDEDGSDRIVGGGRYFRIGTSGGEQRAEVAFLVDDTHQGLGIGSRLFRHLVAIARAAGITRFEAEVLPANEGMLRLFLRSGLPVARTAARDAVHVTIELTADPGPPTGRVESPGAPETGA